MELILYVAILTIILVPLVNFSGVVVQMQAKSSVEQEVWGTGRMIAERIKYEIRNASGINTVTTTSISLGNSNAMLNPTVIDLAVGQVRIKQGVGAITALSGSMVTISNLVFTSYTSIDNKTKNIGFSFTVGETGTRSEYTASQNINGDAEVRSN